MNHVPTPALLPFVLACAAGLAAAPRAHGQASYAESFENVGAVASGQQGPQGLVAAGWMFRNQSSPLGPSPAWQGGGGGGWAYLGDGYLHSTTSAAGQFGAQVSNWAIVPAVAAQQAGDVLSLWVLGGGYGQTATYLDIRYSPTGGTSTGSGATGVGDFTQVLFSGELPISSGPVIYTQVQAPLPGPGRVAIRFHAPAVSNFMSSASFFIDELSVGAPPGPPCGLELPAPGQTVTWPGAPTPYLICQDLVIPASARLILGPGARVEVADGRTLQVDGELIAQGTAEFPVVIVGDHIDGLRVRGRAGLYHADVDASVTLYEDASVEAFDSLFRERAHLSSLQPRTFMRLERCEVRSEAATFARTTLLDDVTITNPQAFASLHGFWRVGSLSSVAPMTFIASMQDRLVDNVSVNGAAGAAALELHSSGGAVDYRLGPGNMLTGNLYPVWARFAGLRPDSHVPASGNLNNAVRGVVNAMATLRSRVSIPDLGVPYHFLERGTVGGEVTIDPGTVLKFGPEGGLTVRGDNGNDGTLRGEPGRPVRLERLDPAQAWLSLATGPGWHLFEHLHIDGAGVGVVGNEAELWLRDSVIANCGIGAHPAADGNIYGSGVRFLGNGLGLRDDPVNPAGQIKSGVHFSGLERPNVFEGNAVAAANFGNTFNGFRHLFRADNNWWGHETGPFEPNFHPQGEGDEVSFGVSFTPFLVQSPDLSDARPVVRLKTRLNPVVLPGEKVFIEWEAFDDGEITSFDVLMLDPNTDLPPGFFFIPLGEDLPGTTRSFEITAPVVGLHPYERFPFRIVARDNAGNSSFEQFWLSVPHQAPVASVSFQMPEGEFRGGEDIEVCFSSEGLTSTPRFYIEAGADDRVVMSAGSSDSCSLGTVRLPLASSDRVRLALRAEGNWNRDEWYFTDYITIRPDPRIGDAPPSVQMTSPPNAASFLGGTTIPVRWTAADDHGLYGFRVQASFNGGYTFHTIVTSLPGTAREFDWRLPASSGVEDLRIRVVAVDTLMQNTSSGDDRVISVLPGSGPIFCTADFDNDGDTGTDADIETFFRCIAGACCPTCGSADFDGDGDTATDADIEAFFRVIAGGPC